MARSAFCLLLVLIVCAVHSGAQEGDPKTTKTKALETGSKVLQSDDPVERMNVYLVGFHPMKDDPSHQMEAHHFCSQLNEDFAQCALFDGGGKDARLNGVEYIISEKLFEGLPAEEKKYWHPHNYEILSGQLVAPGLPDRAEKELMETKINSYGKTWHVWETRSTKGGPQPLPYGDPHLAWSFNRDGEAKQEMVTDRDSRLNVNTTEKRKQRADLANMARPQEGVNVLKDAFPNAKGAPAGVKDKGEAQK